MDQTFPVLDALHVLGTALQVRLRGEVARRDFDASIVTIKTMFALARHLGDYPASAANRLGVSIAEPGARLPDGDDSAAGLPQSLLGPDGSAGSAGGPPQGLSGRPGAGGFGAETAPRRRDDRRADREVRVAPVGDVLDSRANSPAGRPGVSARNWPRSAQDVKNLTDARLRLVGTGCWSAVSLPPTQVILLDELRAFRIRRDEGMKSIALAPWQFESLTSHRKANDEEKGILADLLPGIIEARREQAHVEQRIAILRHVEALCMYAVRHHGTLPGSLEAVDVPLPVDPFTGKAFAYALDGTTARLRCATNGMEKPARNGPHYAITLTNSGR